MSLYHSNLRAFNASQQRFDNAYDDSYDEPEEDDDTYCMCGCEPTMEESDTNQCDCCGRAFE